MSKLFSTVAALVLFAVLGAPADAQSRPAWTQAGMLRCVVNPSIGFIIAGRRSMESPSHGTRRSHLKRMRSRST